MLLQTAGFRVGKKEWLQEYYVKEANVLGTFLAIPPKSHKENLSTDWHISCP